MLRSARRTGKGMRLAAMLAAIAAASVLANAQESVLRLDPGLKFGAAPPSGAPATGGWAPAVQGAGKTSGGGSSTARRKAPVGITATAAALKADATQTAFVMTMSKGVRAEVYTLDAPARVVVDLPDVAFKLESGAGERGAGLVKAFRYGLIEAGKARIVMDTTGPVKVVSADVVKMAGGSGSELRVTLVSTDAASFAAAAVKPTAEAPVAEVPTPRQRKSKPVIVLDPGHGGIDPGAHGVSSITEKAVVLAVAQQIRQLLSATGRYDVHMTRSNDVFVSLDKRLKLSQRLNAELFVSIHADSIAQTQFARSVRGATIYTLSEKASDEEARLLAEKENASDVLAGMETVADENKDQVRNILIDLLKRETSNFSHAFSRLLVDRMRQSIALSKEPERSAAFKVLRQTNSPSVLVELGYMTNPDDEKLLASAEWQRQVATSVASAVDTYFTKRTAGQQ